MSSRHSLEFPCSHQYVFHQRWDNLETAHWFCQHDMFLVRHLYNETPFYSQSVEIEAEDINLHSVAKLLFNY